MSTGLHNGFNTGAADTDTTASTTRSPETSPTTSASSATTCSSACPWRPDASRVVRRPTSRHAASSPSPPSSAMLHPVRAASEPERPLHERSEPGPPAQHRGAELLGAGDVPANAHCPEEQQLTLQRESDPDSCPLRDHQHPPSPGSRSEHAQPPHARQPGETPAPSTPRLHPRSRDASRRRRHRCARSQPRLRRRRARTTRRSSQVVLISLDGARPDVIQRYLDHGVLTEGPGSPSSTHGVVARQNITATPSLTAVAHIAIATGSTAVHNDIPSNTFHPVAATDHHRHQRVRRAIGGYQLNPLGPSPNPSADPLWVKLREPARRWSPPPGPAPTAPTSASHNVVQAAQPIRITDYTVPFGAFGGLGARGSAHAGQFRRRRRRHSLPSSLPPDTSRSARSL